MWATASSGKRQPRGKPASLTLSLRSDNGERHFEVVLALNIFHHFIKQREIFERFEAWLGQLSMDAMIFEPHCSSEPQMSGAYRNFDEREFLDFIIAKTVLNHAELIHRCTDGRPIYRLWR